MDDIDDSILEQLLYSLTEEEERKPHFGSERERRLRNRIRVAKAKLMASAGKRSDVPNQRVLARLGQIQRDRYDRDRMLSELTRELKKGSELSAVKIKKSDRQKPHAKKD